MLPAEKTPFGDTSDEGANFTVQGSNISDKEASVNERPMPVADIVEEIPTQTEGQQGSAQLVPNPQDLNSGAQSAEALSSQAQNPEVQNSEVSSADGTKTPEPNPAEQSPAVPQPVVAGSEAQKKWMQLKYQCGECIYTTDRSFNLKRHRKNMHSAMMRSGRNFHFCCDVGATIATLHELRRHMEEAHCKKYSCVVCGMEFSRLSQRARHMRTHTGEKPYPCPYCGRLFSNLSNMRRHMGKRMCARATVKLGDRAGPSTVPRSGGSHNSYGMQMCSSMAADAMPINLSVSKVQSEEYLDVASRSNPEEFDIARPSLREESVDAAQDVAALVFPQVYMRVLGGEVSVPFDVFWAATVLIMLLRAVHRRGGETGP